MEDQQETAAQHSGDIDGKSCFTRGKKSFLLNQNPEVLLDSYIKTGSKPVLAPLTQTLVKPYSRPDINPLSIFRPTSTHRVEAPEKKRETSSKTLIKYSPLGLINKPLLRPAINRIKPLPRPVSTVKYKEKTLARNRGIYSYRLPPKLNSTGTLKNISTAKTTQKELKNITFMKSSSLIKNKFENVKNSSERSSPSKKSVGRPTGSSAFVTGSCHSRNKSKELSFVHSLLDRSSDEILLMFLKDENKFLTLLNENIDRDVLAYLLIVLEKAITPQLPKHVNSVIHKVTSSEKFFDIITKYLASFHRKSSQNIHFDSLASLVNFLAKFQTCLPSSASDSLTVLFPLLNKTCQLYQVSTGSMSSITSQTLQNIDDRNSAFLKNFTPSEAKGISFKEKLQLEDPPENFRTIPVLPSAGDFLGASAFIRPNIVCGKYQDTEHYLDVQFRLLREDYVKSLRDGVAEYKELKKAGKSVKKSNNLRIYENVQLTSQQILPAGLVYIAVFRNKDVLNVKWESSKRFLLGSLLCISDDDFETKHFAVVAERKIEELKEGKLMVKFEELSDEVLNISPYQKFVVLETTAFFEAYRHNLQTLIELDDEKLPMKRYIVDVEKDVHRPCYLKDDTAYDMRPLLIPLNKEYMEKRDNCIEYTYPSGIDPRAEAITVLDNNSWPTSSELNLDPSQYEALKAATTKEFAIIQGPPGTGKTYIGLRIVQLLLHNKKIWETEQTSSPVLIVCFSNHALDQFLEGLSIFTKRIVRIGGGCKNENIEKYKLSNLRKTLEDTKNVPQHIFYSIRDKENSLKRMREEIESTNKLITKCQNSIFSAMDLKCCLTDVQFLSFRNKNRGVSNKTMYNWLGIDVSEFDEIVFHIDEKLLFKSDLTVDSMGNRIVNINMGVKNGKKQGKYNELKDFEYFMREISQHVSYILNYTSALSSTDALNIQNVWEINIPYRWRLYKFWIQSLVTTEENKCDAFEEQSLKLSYQINELRDTVHYVSSSVLNEYELKDVIPSVQYRTLRKYFHGDYAGMYDWLELKVKNQSNIQNRIEVIQNLIYTVRFIRESCVKTDDIVVRNDVSDFADVEYIAEQRDFDSDDLVGASYEVPLDIKSENLLSTDDWQIQGGPKAVKKIFRKKLHDTVVMPKDQFKNVFNVWELTIEDRWKLYKYWTQRFSELNKQKKHRLLQDLREKHAELVELRSLKDVHVARKADVIGMTTTGAAKYRHIIESLKPSIVVIEEAAEVLECHVVTSLSSETKHVILIGDHLQLRPSPNIHMLSVKYDLNVSLFERLVKNNFEFVQLHIQHRMRPEIAGLLVPHIYKTLENHESVSFLENIRGVNKNVFFISHIYNELKDGDNQSKINQHEASFLISLCEYFINQNYDPSQITILTTYSGQLFELKRMSKGKLEDVRITVVDNYQGEENDIILISFVRSNDNGEIGFLKISNRVCVALSRARKGLFCIGNFNLLAENSKIWQKILEYLNDQECVGSSLQLNCQNHPETNTFVKSSDDFESVPDGGCKVACDYRLSCGHICPKMCHPYNREHEDIRCYKPCTRTCENGHSCEKECFEECHCTVTMPKMLLCGHEIITECYCKIEDIICPRPCERKLDCGHKCLNECGKKCTSKCLEVITITPSCGHEMDIKCYRKDDENFLISNCQQPCEMLLPCGHVCSGLCKNCNCNGKKHHTLCHQKCNKVLPCGHECKSLCYEKCPPCSVPVLKKSKLCNHEREIKCHLKIEEVPCKVKCEKKLLCGHKTLDKCFLKVEEIKCTDSCDGLLPCGHKCLKKCGESCTSKCKNRCSIVSAFCGHVLKVECSRSKDGDYLTDRCSAPCSAELQCGHVCRGTCSSCHQRRLHIACNQKCKRVLICGHNCESVCSKPCPPCKKPCENFCSHRKCLKLCSEPCEPCTKPCTWICLHKKCSQRCCDLCDREPCDEPCLKTLNCQHPCLGFCGETCPTVCNACEIGGKDLVTDDKKFIILEDCGHFFEIKSFEKWINKMMEKTSVIKAIFCPQCQTAIKRNYRFGNIIKSSLADIENAKKLAFNNDPSLHRNKIKPLFFADKLSTSNLKYFLVNMKNVVTSKKLRTISEIKTIYNFYTLIKVFVNLTVFARRADPDSRDALNNRDLMKFKSYIRTTCSWMEPVLRDDFLTASEQQLLELSWEVHRLRLADKLLRYFQGKCMIETKSKLLRNSQVKYMIEMKRSWTVLMDCIMTYSPFRDFDSLNFVLRDLEYDDKELYEIVKDMLKLNDPFIFALDGYSTGNFLKCSNNHVYRAWKKITFEKYETSCPKC